MTIRSDLVVNTEESPRIVTVEAPSTTISIQDLHDTLRHLEALKANMDNPPFIDTAGLESLGDISVGLTSTLQNMQLQFEGRTSPTESGTCTADDSTGKELNAAGGQFITNSVARGHIVFNSTTGAMATVLTVPSETQITHQILSGGSRSTWLNTDIYIIYNNVQCTITGGNLVAVDEAGSPIPAILGSANTDTILALSSSATVVTTGSGVLPSDVTDIANQVWANTLEGTYTAEEIMRIMSAVLAGKSSKTGGVRTFRDMNDTKDRAVASVTDAGDRTAVVLDGT